MITGGGGPMASPMADANDASSFALEPGQYLPCVDIGRSVVDDHDLGGGPRLTFHAVQRFDECSAEVVAGDDRGDSGGRHEGLRHRNHQPYASRNGAMSRQLRE